MCLALAWWLFQVPLEHTAQLIGDEKICDPISKHSLHSGRDPESIPAASLPSARGAKQKANSFPCPCAKKNASSTHCIGCIFQNIKEDNKYSLQVLVVHLLPFHHLCQEGPNEK